MDKVCTTMWDWSVGHITCISFYNYKLYIKWKLHLLPTARVEGLDA